MQTTSVSPTYDQLSQEIGWGSLDAQLDPTKAAVLDRWVVGKKVLDMGCATGVYSQYLVQKGFGVTGIDHNPRLLSLAKKRAPKGSFIEVDMTRLPFDNKYFDTVVAFDVLEHINEEVLMKELIRVARKRIILCVPHTTKPELADLFLLYGHHIDPTHLRTYTPLKIQQLLKTYRLKLLLIQPSHPLSTDALFLALFSAPLWVKRLLRKVSFVFGKPRKFYTNIMVVAEK